MLLLVLGFEKGDVEEACRAALMREFVRDLPLGYENILGGGAGVGLSGGQKQRLSITRARLRDPTVLILGKLPISLSHLRLIFFGFYFPYTSLRGHQNTSLKMVESSNKVSDTI
jgi:hypothetical protein